MKTNPPAGFLCAAGVCGGRAEEPGAHGVRAYLQYGPALLGKPSTLNPKP